MAKFVSTFITGFEEVVIKDLSKRLPKCKILNVFDGLIFYEYTENSRNLENINYFNNTFFVLHNKTARESFNNLFSTVNKKKNYFLINKGTFRIRFCEENQFIKVEKDLTKKVETYILTNSNLKLDRVNPTTEFWFVRRRENFSFFGQLISKRLFTEKNLNKGELRPEIAYLICSFANITKSSIIADPFCGYSSIPNQIVKNFDFKKLYISDIDKSKVDYTKNINRFHCNQNIEISTQDALILDNISDKSLDLIITDPPWGYYEEIFDIELFYNKLFLSFSRVLKDDGKVILLSARKSEIEKAGIFQNFKISKKINTLVNGKKASVYEFVK